MGGLGHYLEQEGVASVQISLIRLHTEKIRPPRALWVPFELGRPLGAPNEPEFQTRVLLAALRLLEAPAGPVLADFPDEAPEAADGPWACPVSFPAPEADISDAQALARAFAAEFSRLGSWYQLSLEKRGRTVYGVSGLRIDDLADFFAGLFDAPEPENPRPEMELSALIKLASEDLKTYYLEAALARPGGGRPGSVDLNDWFWRQTRAGEMLLALREVCLAHPDQGMQLLGGLLLAPRSQVHRDRGGG